MGEHEVGGTQAAGVVTASVAPRDGLRERLDDSFRRDYVPLVRLAAMLVDRDSAEEIVQDAFVRVHGRLHRVHPDKVGAYLRAAVVNGARSQLRRRRVRREHVPEPQPDAPAAELEGVAGAHRRELLRSLDRLPARQREVLLLRYYADLSEAEIAEALGISAGSVKTHASRGLAALARDLEAPHA
jgi:RNA polymerase sigma-70 factor (sigma-E family)